jgi:redox-sensitive bicupin YhaK (pirin superfamily)
MIALRKSSERGLTRLDWLDSRHSFSFGDYYDPAHMGFGPLRVINEDRVAPGKGFPTHGHRDMEIITYVLEGELRHKDSLGSGSLIRPGDVQRMSAGQGVAHSEYNPSDRNPVHFLQIWIEPKFRGIAPGYAQREFPAEEKRGRLRVVASPDGRDGSVPIHQDATVLAALLEPGAAVDYPLAPGRRAYLHLARGKLRVNGEPLETGDGAAVTGAAGLSVAALEDSEVLLFDLP